MTLDRGDSYLISFVSELLKLPKETEWLEFKQNNADPERIGQYLSGLANSAVLLGKANAYLFDGHLTGGGALTGESRKSI